MDPGSARKRSISNGANDSRPQKRKVTRACDICKAKKAKCSGNQPCESCANRGWDCLYQSSYSRGKPPEVPLSNARARLGPSDLHVDGNMQATHSPAFDTQEIQAPSRASPELEILGQYSDSTSGLSFLHRAWTRLHDNRNSQLAEGALETSVDDQLLVSAGDKPFQRRTEKLRIPPLSKCHELLALYFDICIATYRILHRPTVELWLPTVVGNAQKDSHLAEGISNAQASIVLTVLAVASFHEAKAQGSDGSSETDEALLHCDLLFSESAHLVETETGYPTLESAQARLIQVLYLLTSCRMNQAWYTFGHTLLIISTLGLHRREHRRGRVSPRNFIEEQCRKRTFWVAYTLDKYLGVVFGRPRHYHDDDIDQDLPDPVNDEDMTVNGPRNIVTDDCHINSLIYHAKLAQIGEQILRQVYSIKRSPDHEKVAASHELGLQLRQWKASLPPILGAVNPSSLIPAFRRQATVLKLSYCHAVILAHRPFLLKNVSQQPAEVRKLASESIDECIGAAQSVLVIVDRVAQDGKLFHAFWWTHYVAFCALAVVYVWSIQRCRDLKTVDGFHEEILNRAEQCLNHLAQATASNSPSRRYSIILQELRSEAKRKIARRLETADVLANHREGEGISDSTTNISTNQNADIDHWNPMFRSSTESTSPQIAKFLDGWQTTDWLDLDSSAFGPFPVLEDNTINWMSGISEDR
ncbi:unnamed protein product [Periconia digitata]|uniref:Zn(2)-C6 fungal-type domain-containing protein n=1 Tax=Periconia digitata TaxID=1303443 RepID=A0A9W4UHT6_9PLEO|nr:unnamed protein product [Periconia digitata]